MSTGLTSSESNPELGPRAALRSWTSFSKALLVDMPELESGRYGMLLVGALFNEVEIQWRYSECFGIESIPRNRRAWIGMPMIGRVVEIGLMILDKGWGHIFRSLVTCRPRSVSKKIRHTGMAQEVRVL